MAKTYGEKAVELARKKIAKMNMKDRKKFMIKLPKFWWLPAIFRDKIKLEQSLQETTQVLGNYANHAAEQAEVLKNLYRWALQHDPGDGSLDPFKEKLGQIPEVGEVGGINGLS